MQMALLKEIDFIGWVGEPEWLNINECCGYSIYIPPGYKTSLFDNMAFRIDGTTNISESVFLKNYQQYINRQGQNVATLSEMKNFVFSRDFKVVEPFVLDGENICNIPHQT